ncbi:hypothetical protein E3U43_019355 [Larimichthys crocea]|uniref:Uncharacterized protein n=1 Tax=Larimichthys crocea TaxID=215358 RepID=A0ACD3QT77_LARCR|nr:hypothetical protein E3U43_019355 [Larimichthys crocea]
MHSRSTFLYFRQISSMRKDVLLLVKGREQDTEGELPTSSRSISERERPEDARVSACGD